MNPNSLVSIDDLGKEEILDILADARFFEENPNHKILDGKVVATLFFEPSTRTRLSFETAVNRLGGRVIGFSDANTSSSSKGESLKDTIKMVSNYVDLIIMRHYQEGAAKYATTVTETPVINAGDGSNQHPSQTMLDLYSIMKTQGKLDNLEITMVGDLKYGRTVHSLLMAMRYFSPKFRFVSCPELAMPQEYIDLCERLNHDFGIVIPDISHRFDETFPAFRAVFLVKSEVGLVAYGVCRRGVDDRPVEGENRIVFGQQALRDFVRIGVQAYAQETAFPPDLFEKFR